MRPASAMKVEQTARMPSAAASGVFVLLILLVGEIIISTRAIELERWAKDASTLVPLGAAGALCGFALGRTRVPDLLSHLWAVVVGIGLTVLATAYQADHLGVPFISRVRYLADLGKIWLRDSTAGRPADDDLLFIVALGLLIWLVGYAAAWFLFRRGWILPAVVLPGMLIVISVTNGGVGSSTAALVYVVLALALAAVQVARLRTAAWQRAGLGFSTIAWRASAIGGSVIAALAVILVWSAPVNPPDGLMNAAADRLDGPMSSVQSAWNDLARRLSPNNGAGESFAQFDDQFQMGGELDLGDQPVVILQSDEPHYLAAQRYSDYTGQGWTSDLDLAFQQGPDGVEPTDAPSLTFRPGQSVYLSDNVLESRDLVEGTIRILTPTGGRLLTIETYLSSSERVSASMSWHQLIDEPFDLAQLEQRDLPVELRQLVMLLRQTSFVSDSGAEGFVATDANLGAQIDSEIASLTSRFLQVRWSIDEQGRVQTLFVTGFLPNYDDVDAVSPDEGLSEGDVYEVAGWQSFATAEELRAASADQPPFVTGRYLALPDGVSDRTRQLAADVAGTEASTFNTAMAIQNYLRSAYAYDEKISGPSGGEDAVDYFLFDEQRGYCEYFASAMVVMLRSLDVPSRLVAGFREVAFDEDVDGYLYREKQAHTWVEVYFPGYGWIPFEPTPAQNPFDYEDSGEPPAELESPTPEFETPTPEPTTQAEPTATPGADGANMANTDRGDDDGLTRGQYLSIAAGLVAAGSVLGFVLFRRRQDRIEPGARLYRHLVGASRHAGVRPTPSTTPRELAMRLGDAAPVMRTPASTISRLYRKELYGGQPLTDDERWNGETAWRSMRRALSMRWVRRKSWRQGE